MQLNAQPTSRYEIIAKIAAGGMATVYLGALKGPFGFEQLVAIKRLHAHLLDDPAVRESLLIEARSASRIRHVNVVDVRDVEVLGDVVQLVMTYIEGTALSTLLVNATRNKTKIPPGIAIRIILDACAGLHAAHELADSTRRPLELVHRDVSPQNVLVGIDGIARITDFGVARDESSHRLRTNTGALKGKFAYMAPEYIRGKRPDRRVDVFALAVVLWEALAGRRLFKGTNDAETISRVTDMNVPRIAHLVPELGEGIDAVFEMALSKNPDTRFSTAQALGLALETVALKAKIMPSSTELGQYVRENAREDLVRLEQLRDAAARCNKTKEDEVRSIAVPTDSADETTKSVKPPRCLMRQATPEDTQVAAANYQNQVASMMGDDINAAHIHDTPTTRRDIAPTLRTPSSEHVEMPTPSVAVVSAPAVTSEDLLHMSTSAKRSGPLGTALMGPIPLMRELVFRHGPETNGSPEPRTKRHDSLIASGFGPPGSALTTLPVPIRRESIAVLPFNQDKRVQFASSRLRWVLAACLVFLLSGVGLALLVAPGVRDEVSTSDAKK